MTAIRANLPYRSFRCVGDDALMFLQGQVSQDIALINQGKCHYAAYCNHKAQMFANLLVYGKNNDYILRLHEAQADAVSKRLGMFLLRAKATIEALDGEHIGLNYEAATQICEQHGVTLPEVFGCVAVGEGTLCALPNGYFELSFFTRFSESSEFSELPDGTVDLSAITEDFDAIESLRLSGGHFHIYPTTSEQILPQQTALEAWGGINYQKGCYVGQEIIARNKYRGKARKGMGSAIIDTALDLALPANVMQGTKKVGQIIDSYHSDSRTTSVAILSLDALEQPVEVEGIETRFNPIPAF